jgi:hypothetical protein
VSTSGAVSGRLWWVSNAALLLVVSFVLSSCSNSAASALSATPTSETNPDVKIIHVLVVDDHYKPVPGGIIRVPGTVQEDTDDDEGYWLQFCIEGEIIVATAPGYQENSIPCDGLRNEYQVVLMRLPDTKPLLDDVHDDPNYSWRSASGDCSTCHGGSRADLTDEYSGWARSGHAMKITDPYFESMYKGISTNGQTTAPGFRLDYPNEYGNCVYCHLPAAVGPSLQEVDLWNFLPALNGDARREGITCDVCHKVKDVKLDDNHYPYSDRPGILSFDFGRSQTSPRLMIGPYLNPKTSSGSQESIACASVFSQSEFCAACHYGKFYDAVIYNSYGEWRQSEKYSQRVITSTSGRKEENEKFRSCQDCHMSSSDTIGTPLPSSREACSSSSMNWSNFNHDVMHYEPDTANPSVNISRLIKDAADMKVEFDPKTSADMLRVIVKVTNIKAGHKFPTDSPLRHLLLVVVAKDLDDHVLPQINDSRIPNWGGVGSEKPFGMEAYGGMPGKIFANLLVEKDTHLFPTAAYWKPTRSLAQESSDTRLLPDKTDESDYIFSTVAEDKIKITVKLLYRFAFFDLALQKKWNRPDIVVVSQECIVDLSHIDLARCD